LKRTLDQIVQNTKAHQSKPNDWTEQSSEIKTKLVWKRSLRV